MSRKYKFRANSKFYFISFAVVYWIDVFIRNEYKNQLLESWKYCQKEKGLEIYVLCIMSSQFYMITRSRSALAEWRIWVWHLAKFEIILNLQVKIYYKMSELRKTYSGGLFYLTFPVVVQ